MSVSMKLNNFTDFDRFLTDNNFFITLNGALVAFGISYFKLYIPLPFPPYQLSLALAVMLFVAILTKNIASTAIVGLVGSLGIQPVEGNNIGFIAGYILINFVILIFLGLLADRLRLVMDWVKFYLWSAILITIATVSIGYFYNDYAGRYWSRDIEIGNGGDPRADTSLPITDLAVVAGVTLIVLFFLYLLRGQILLHDRSIMKYRVFGTLFVLVGYSLTLVGLYLFLGEISLDVLREIADSDTSISTMNNLFYHQTGGPYAVFLNPMNIFFLIPITYTLIAIGSSLLMIAHNKGNLEGVKGGSEIVHMAAPLAVIAYILYAHYFVQDLIAPGGVFIPLELYPVFALAIWLVFYFNQITARVLLFIFDRLS